MSKKSIVTLAVVLMPFGLICSAGLRVTSETRAAGENKMDDQLQMHGLISDVATLKTDLDKTRMELKETTKKLNELKRQLVLYGSEIRLQVKNKPVLIGTRANSNDVGATVDVGVLDDNDNWFTIIRRQPKK